MTAITLNQIPFAGAAARAFAMAAQQVRRVLAAGWTTVELWYERAHQRRHLMGLDARLLSDIGLSRADAEREARKRFWQP